MQIKNISGVRQLLVHDVQGRKIFDQAFTTGPTDIYLDFTERSQEVYFGTLILEAGASRHIKILLHR